MDIGHFDTDYGNVLFWGYLEGQICTGIADEHNQTHCDLGLAGDAGGRIVGKDNQGSIWFGANTNDRAKAVIIRKLREKFPRIKFFVAPYGTNPGSKRDRMMTLDEYETTLDLE